LHRERNLTIDAMGTQKKIAEQILDKKADYILQVKGNQETLEREISVFYIRYSKKVVEISFLRKPIYEYSPCSGAAQDYKKFDAARTCLSQKYGLYYFIWWVFQDKQLCSLNEIVIILL